MEGQTFRSAVLAKRPTLQEQVQACTALQRDDSSNCLLRHCPPSCIGDETVTITEAVLLFSCAVLAIGLTTSLWVIHGLNELLKQQRRGYEAILADHWQLLIELLPKIKPIQKETNDLRPSDEAYSEPS